MSFRKRNIGISSGDNREINQSTAGASTAQQAEALPGVRPSPDDGRPTTSTGSRSLDNLLAGHSGLPLGKILLIGENGTTDFAGALLRYYAAEGVVQEHRVHVVGIGEQWGRTLPGLIGSADSADEKTDRRRDEKMKIAWRYERLGEFGAGSRVPTEPADKSAAPADKQQVFCHAFDLTKRLTHPSLSTLNYIPLAPSRGSPFLPVMQNIRSAISASPPNTVHRIVIPALLNPGTYPPDASQPDYLIQFIHSLRALLSQNTHNITAVITLPLSLYPRSSGLVRWIELLCDGVIELCPFPHSSDAIATSGAATANEEPPQGTLKTHRLPVLHERGGGSDQNIGVDWAFTLSRRKFEIKPFSLPPAEGDNEAQQAVGNSAMPKKADLEF
ncbi:PAXNEB protein superfamily [Talaromyces proteolyticus]|uniref:Elongator complex protein 4 n=1 Tax=Talaromyces proteolyticus TaxID=1131652 RepID=A0AAD4L7Q4_9EURO|nr:PAXNEB protein superfamily [Talaromyces proteolyticus]KAH8705469.1 PAXNEB protein superfamily [Talaromyces proteolyticus]